VLICGAIVAGNHLEYLLSLNMTRKSAPFVLHLKDEAICVIKPQCPLVVLGAFRLKEHATALISVKS